MVLLVKVSIQVTGSRDDCIYSLNQDDIMKEELEQLITGLEKKKKQINKTQFLIKIVFGV
jgi:hypothetical protein